MASKSNVQMSATEQLAAYRAAAKSLSPKKPESTLGDSIKLAVASAAFEARTFGSDVAAIYKVKMAQYNS